MRNVGNDVSLIRSKNNNLEFGGKLPKLWKMLQDAKGELGDDFPVDDHVQIHVHHYMATQQAVQHVKSMLDIKQRAKNEWFDTITSSYGLQFMNSLPITQHDDQKIWALTEKYYDPGIESAKHMKASGDTHWKRGYGECALPLVLEHNTPNNSLALLWAESNSPKKGVHTMRPLFYRQQRHT